MAIDGETIKAAEFTLDNGEKVLIDLKIREIILFRLIERLTRAIRGLK